MRRRSCTRRSAGNAPGWGGGEAPPRDGLDLARLMRLLIGAHGLLAARVSARLKRGGRALPIPSWCRDRTKAAAGAGGC
eukprot:scaffold7832_cov106-Isochrysis_galbana.AAC.13